MVKLRPYYIERDGDAMFGAPDISQSSELFFLNLIYTYKIWSYDII